MQRVTAPKAANPGICPLAMSSRKQQSSDASLIQPPVHGACGKWANRERRKGIFPSANHTYSLCLPREKSLPVEQDERREPVVIFLFKLIAESNVFHFTVSHSSLWLWPWHRPFPPEAQATLCEPVLLSGPCLACSLHCWYHFIHPSPKSQQ